MAAPTCTKAGLSASCYKTPGAITPRQVKTLTIYAKVLQLAAIGGTDYRSLLATTLLSDAATLTCGFDKSDLDAAMVQIAYNNATTAGASVGTLATQVNNARCLEQATEDQLDEALVLLQCKLGVHKAYPQ